MKNRNIIEQVISEQKQELSRLLKYDRCHRNEEEQVDLESDLAQIIIGVRRSGKSTLCYNVIKKSDKKFAYINFDDERLADLTSEDLNLVLKVLYEVYGDFTNLFIDEIQNIPEWFLFANRILRQGIKLLITGSNAKLLSGELATHLTGRYNKIELYPFSFYEYCSYKNIDIVSHTTKAEADRHVIFKDYLKTGGFPELLKEKNSVKYIETLVESILSQDIRRRYFIRYAADFTRLTNHILNIAPAKLNVLALQQLFKIKSNHTVANYVDYLKNAYLITLLKKFSFKSSLRVRDEKIYPVDVALMNNRYESMAGDNFGWRLETIVYIELTRQYKPIGYDIFYYSTQNYEVDFVICKGNKVVKIYQVAYDISNEKTKKREIKALLNASETLDCNQVYLITDGDYENIAVNGNIIEVLPASEWLIFKQQ